MKRATEALVKSAQQVKEREDEANVQVNKRMVGGVAQVIHNIECVFSSVSIYLLSSRRPTKHCLLCKCSDS